MTKTALPVRRKVRGKPFQRGNPGRPKGARNRTTRALELLSGRSEEIIAKAVELALQGDPSALKLCFQLIAGQRRERAVPISLPPIRSVSDAADALAAVVAAVGEGVLSPAEGNEFSQLISSTVDAFQRADLEQRIERLEKRNKDDEESTN